MAIIENLLGKVINKIVGLEKNSEEFTFYLDSGKMVTFFHEQDCCESVRVNDICGDIEDLIDTPILDAREESNGEDCEEGHRTWTFYIFRTIKGSVTIIWRGYSNGYYSERVSIEF